MVVKADFLVGGKVAVCTLILLLEQMVRVVLHMAFEEAPRAKLLSTDVARVDGQRHPIWSNDNSWTEKFEKRESMQHCNQPLLF